MDRIDSLYLFLGLILVFPFFHFWNQNIKSTKRIPPVEWLGLFFFYQVFQVLGSGVIYHSGEFQWKGIETIAQSTVGFVLYYLFANSFLSERVFPVRLFFLLWIGLVLHPVHKYFLDWEPSWGSGEFHLSLASLVFLGYVFLSKSQETIHSEKVSQSDTIHDTIRELDFIDSAYFLFGLFSLALLQMGNLPRSGMDSMHSLSMCFWTVSVSGMTAWFVHTMSGRRYSANGVVITAIWAGFSAYSSLPLSAGIGGLLLLGFGAGILPTVLSTIALRKVPNWNLFILFFGSGWGGILGILSYGFLQYSEFDSFEVLGSLRNRLILSGFVIFSTLLIGWVGVGIGILLDRIYSGKKSSESTH